MIRSVRDHYKQDAIRENFKSLAHELEGQLKNHIVQEDKENVYVKGPVLLKTKLFDIDVKDHLYLKNTWGDPKVDMKDARSDGVEYHKPNLPVELLFQN